MLFDRIKQQFTARRRTEDGNPDPTVWVEGGEEATLINPESGRMHAYVQHDGQGVYYPVLVVSPWRAVKLIRQHDAALVSLLSFPRCTIEVRKLGCETLGLAGQQAEYGLGLYD